MKKCAHFAIHELVDRQTFEKDGEGAWSYIQPHIAESLDDFWEFLQERTGKRIYVTINNYGYGGNREWSGLRFGPAFDLENIKNKGKYADRSFHKLGLAFDCVFRGITAEEVRSLIKQNKYDRRIQCISRIEDGVSWLHIDFANIPQEQKPYFFKP